MDDTQNDLSRLVNSIDHPIVCSRCADDVAEGRAGAISMADYAKLDVGFSAIGLQVWCRRHDANVVHVDFQGHPLPADFRCLEPRPLGPLN